MEPNRRQINKKYPQAILKDVFCFMRQALVISSVCKAKKTPETDYVSGVFLYKKDVRTSRLPFFLIDFQFINPGGSPCLYLCRSGDEQPQITVGDGGERMGEHIPAVVVHNIYGMPFFVRGISSLQEARSGDVVVVLMPGTDHFPTLHLLGAAQVEIHVIGGGFRVAPLGTEVAVYSAGCFFRCIDFSGTADDPCAFQQVLQGPCRLWRFPRGRCGTADRPVGQPVCPLPLKWRQTRRLFRCPGDVCFVPPPARPVRF